MTIRRNPDAGRRAVAILATAFVVFIGALLTAFVVLSFSERGGWQPWVVWSVLFGSVVAMLWALTDKREGRVSLLSAFLIRAREKADPLSLYKFRKRQQSADRPLGSNQPPTLDSLRETSQESSVTWVPHGTPPRREPRKR